MPRRWKQHATFSYDKDGRAAGINAASSFKTSCVLRFTLEVGVIMAPLITHLAVFAADENHGGDRSEGRTSRVERHAI
jgi:hypothetical protein